MPCDGSAKPSTFPSKKPPGCWGQANRPFAPSKAAGCRYPRNLLIASLRKPAFERSGFLRIGLKVRCRTRLKLRRWSNEAQQGLPPTAERSEYVEGNFPDGYMATLVPTSVLLRFLILQRLIARELGFPGCQHTGFFDMIVKLNLRLLGRVPGPRRVRHPSTSGIQGHRFPRHGECHESDHEDLQEILTAVRENKIRAKSSRKPPLRLHPANASAAKALRKTATRNRR